MISSVTTSSANSGGVISFDGGSPITVRGTVWSTSHDPTITLAAKTVDGSGTGTFTSIISGLDGAKTYYVRAYATNVAGTEYGNELSFYTLGQVPSDTTLTATNVSLNTAVLQASVNANDLTTVVTFEFGTTVDYGNIVAAAQSPVTGSTNTIVSADIAGLSPGTTYHFRIKAVNSLGTTFGNDVSFITLINDIDGNVYNIVTYGTQVWMVENLRTTRYNDGTYIPLVTDDAEWAALSTPAYSWYDNDSKYYTYGALYNIFAANQVFTDKNICPAGWHVSKDEEWITLNHYLEINGFGYENFINGVAKSMSATSNWESTSITGTPGNDQISNNSSGFTAFPGGMRYINPSTYANTKSPFLNMGNLAVWWVMPPHVIVTSGKAWSSLLTNDYQYIRFIEYDQRTGLSVRCVRD